MADARFKDTRRVGSPRFVVQERREGGWYDVGDFSDLSQAQSLVDDLKSAGVPLAIVKRRTVRLEADRG